MEGEAMNGQVPDKPTPDQLLNALGDLDDQLRDAYKAANTIEVKDKIFSIMEVVGDGIDVVSNAALKSTDEKYQAFNTWAKQYNNDLKQFADDIDKYVSYIKTAGQVVDALAQVAKYATMLAA
jgi:hypothetical protein